MPFAKGHPRLGGRKTGVPNKVNGAFKDALLQAFYKIGGMDALAAWGEQPANRAAFYSICGRLVPTEVKGSSDPNDEPVRHVVQHIYKLQP